MRFELSKLGGVVGLARRPLTVDTSSLDSAHASELVSLAERARVFERPSSLAPADAPDQLGYELRVSDGDRQASLEFAYKDADQSLAALIRALRGAGSQ